MFLYAHLCCCRSRLLLLCFYLPWEGQGPNKVIKTSLKGVTHIGQGRTVKAINPTRTWPLLVMTYKSMTSSGHGLLTGAGIPLCVPQMFPICPHIFPICSLCFPPRMSPCVPLYSPWIPHMFPLCTPCVPHVFPMFYVHECVKCGRAYVHTRTHTHAHTHTHTHTHTRTCARIILRRTDGHTNRPTDRQTDRRTDRHTHRRTDRQTDGQRARQTDTRTDGQTSGRTNNAFIYYLSYTYTN